MVMVVMMVVMMLMMIAQQKGADDINRQTQGRYEHGLVEMNELGGEQTLKGFDDHDQGNRHQGNGAGEPAQDTDLAGAKGESSGC